MREAPRPQRGLKGIKPYVPGKPIEEVERELGLQNVIKLASNENPLGVSPKALAAAERALRSANLYPDAASYDLRTAIGEHFGFPRDCVAVGNGADDLILQLAMSYLDEGDEVIVSRSSFPIYDVYVHAMRATMVKTPLTEQLGIDLPAMADAIGLRTKIAVVCNPNNPTGTMVAGDALDAFLRCVPDHVLVVIDEAYAEMADSQEFPDSLSYVREGRPNVVVLRTFSKVYGLAGIRLGYAFAVAEIVATMMRIKMVFNVSVLAQAAGIAALGDEEFLKKSVAANKTGRQQLCRAFDRLGLTYADSHTNFVLVRIGPDALTIQQELLHDGVIVRPCAGYDLPEHLRISIGTPEQNERLIQALSARLGAR
jgi:histidinol-phosphate aminotransferase